MSVNYESAQIEVLQEKLAKKSFGNLCGSSSDSNKHKESLATLNIKMLKRLSYSMNELLNVCLLSNLRRFDEAIMSQFEG